MSNRQDQGKSSTHLRWIHQSSMEQYPDNVSTPSRDISLVKPLKWQHSSSSNGLYRNNRAMTRHMSKPSQHMGKCVKGLMSTDEQQVQLGGVHTPMTTKQSETINQSDLPEQSEKLINRISGPIFQMTKMIHTHPKERSTSISSRGIPAIARRKSSRNHSVKPSLYSRITDEISNSQDAPCLTHSPVHNSLTPSGPICSRESPLISTMSCLDSSPSRKTPGKLRQLRKARRSYKETRHLHW
jgi:hypothetical protein